MIQKIKRGGKLLLGTRHVLNSWCRIRTRYDYVVDQSESGARNNSDLLRSHAWHVGYESLLASQASCLAGGVNFLRHGLVKLRRTPRRLISTDVSHRIAKRPHEEPVTDIPTSFCVKHTFTRFPR